MRETPNIKNKVKDEIKLNMKSQILPIIIFVKFEKGKSISKQYPR